MDDLGRSKFITKETFWKSIPRETPYSGSVLLRFLEELDLRSRGFAGASSSSSPSSSFSESFRVFASSVAKMISYTPLLNSSTI